MKMVSIMVDDAIISECRRNGWHYRELFMAGVERRRGDPNVEAKIRELEEGNKKLQQKLSQFWQQIAAMTPKVE